MSGFIPISGTTHEFSLDDGLTWVILSEVVKIDPPGSSGSFLDTTSIKDKTKKYMASGLKETKDINITVSDIADPSQLLFKGAADSDKTIKFRWVFPDVDATTCTIDLVLSGSECETEGKLNRVFKGKQSGEPDWS